MTGNSPTLMADIIAIYQEETNAVKDAEGLVSSCIFQPIGTNLAPHFARNGGNALGIDLTKGPQIRTYPIFCLLGLSRLLPRLYSIPGTP